MTSIAGNESPRARSHDWITPHLTKHLGKREI